MMEGIPATPDGSDYWLIEGLNQYNKERQSELQDSLLELQKKIDAIEKEYFLTGEMSKETYEKFIARFAKEKEEILSRLAGCTSKQFEPGR